MVDGGPHGSVGALGVRRRGLRARAETEACFFHLCLDQDIPKPRVNRLVDAGPEHFKVDFHWPAARLIVETDSPYHDTAAARRRDDRRDILLERAGWTVSAAAGARSSRARALAADLESRLAAATGSFTRMRHVCAP